MSYAPNYTDLWRRAADFVDKILKGAKPADIPVEQPTKFEFLVNLKTAKQIGVTIPPNVLARADRVIKMNFGFSIFDFGLGRRHMKRYSRSEFPILVPTIENPKSKIENGWGLSPSCSHSQCVGRWPRRSSRRKFPG